MVTDVRDSVWTCRHTAFTPRQVSRQHSALVSQFASFEMSRGVVNRPALATLALRLS